MSWLTSLIRLVWACGVTKNKIYKLAFHVMHQNFMGRAFVFKSAWNSCPWEFFFIATSFINFRPRWYNPAGLSKQRVLLESCKCELVYYALPIVSLVIKLRTIVNCLYASHRTSHTVSPRAAPHRPHRPACQMKYALTVVSLEVKEDTFIYLYQCTGSVNLQVS